MPLSRQLARGALSLKSMIDTVVVAPGEASGSSLAIPKIGRPGGDLSVQNRPRNFPSAGRLSMPHEEEKISTHSLTYTAALMIAGAASAQNPPAQSGPNNNAINSDQKTPTSQ